MGTVGIQGLHACVHQESSNHMHRGCRVKGLFPLAGNPTADQLPTTTHFGCVSLSVYLCLILPPAGSYYSNCTNCGLYVARSLYGLFTHSSVGAAWLLCGTVYSYVWLHSMFAHSITG